ncbi:LysR family transcriptional regulator [Kribbella sp. NPDC002412]
MELRHLRYFVAVAEELHFGRAAVRLGIRQPPLSQQIKALEDDLGVVLFDRDSRKVRLTAAGEALYPAARDLLGAARAAEQATRQAGRGESGRLALGFVGSATNQLLPRALRDFRQRYPEVSLRLRELTTMQQVHALRDGSLDIGLLRPPLPEAEAAGLVVEPIGAERLVAVVPDDHPRARQRVVAVRDLAEEPFVLFPRALGPGLHDQILAYCAEAGFTPVVAQEAVQMQTIVALVAAGLGVSLVPASMKHSPRHGAVFRSLSPATRVVHLAVARRAGATSPVVRNFVAAVSRSA